jgi:SAM-dependent methyltransferase
LFLQTHKTFLELCRELPVAHEFCRLASSSDEVLQYFSYLIILLGFLQSDALIKEGQYCRHVIGVDIDSDALEIAKDNIVELEVSLRNFLLI